MMCNIVFTTLYVDEDTNIYDDRKGGETKLLTL
jgi:hypothetical protein